MKIKQVSLFLVVLLVMTGFMSCDLNSNDEASLAIIGEWDAGYDSKVVISSSEFKSYYLDNLSFSAKIVSFDNSEWNASETGDGNYGYMVIQYDIAPTWAPQIKDKFMVLRWENFIEEKSMDYSEGYNGVTEEYFDTADDAIEGATIAKGFFSFFSTTSKL